MKRALALCAVWFTSASAAAHPLEDFGFDPRAISMAGAEAAAADDYTAAFYNPSLLPLRRDIDFGFGFTFVHPDMYVSGVSACSSGQSPCWAKPPNSGAFTLGLLFPLSGKVHNRVSIALGVYHPSSDLLRLDLQDPSTPYWFDYQSNASRIVAVGSIGIRATDHILIGAGVQALADVLGENNFGIDLFSKQVTFRSVDVSLYTTGAPIVGATVLLFDGSLRLSGVWRGQEQLHLSLPTQIQIEGVGTLDLNIEGYAHWSPNIFIFAARYDYGGLTITAEADYERWSTAPSPYASVQAQVGGQAIDALGLGNALSLSTQDNVPLGFQDIVIPRVGIEYRLTSRFVARAGYYFRPTPVPIQTQYTNILDGPTHCLSAGLEVNFDDPLEIFEKPIRLLAGFQGLLVESRFADKPSDSVVPSYGYGGKVGIASVAVHYDF
jgi:hypothetical protein